MLQQELVLPWEDRRHRRGCKRRRKNNVHEYIQYIKYGAGIAAGITVVGWIKRKIQGIPVVGILATPFLCLMPTVLLGTAVGAAVVYGIDEGDPLAAQKKVLPKVQKSITSAHKEVRAAASEVSRSIRDIHKQHIDSAELAARESEAVVSRLAKSLDRAAAEAEVTLAPTLHRHANNAKRQLDRHLNTAAEEYNRWLTQQQNGNIESAQGLPLLASGTESE